MPPGDTLVRINSSARSEIWPWIADGVSSADVGSSINGDSPADCFFSANWGSLAHGSSYELVGLTEVLTNVSQLIVFTWLMGILQLMGFPKLIRFPQLLGVPWLMGPPQLMGFPWLMEVTSLMEVPCLMKFPWIIGVPWLMGIPHVMQPPQLMGFPQLRKLTSLAYFKGSKGHLRTSLKVVYSEAEGKSFSNNDVCNEQLNKPSKLKPS